ncbi:right-handed parallel beta-helix repeat-containing protein [Pedobacter sp. SD-b]|uniref:Right-handed parallel beta-helix repeat-containing protein n=1 Tax=Pedobacter segetis TaxID=2793069 RepID=A0ABS1BMW7_9SPHI|nr:right-handed parallel beta-helix repeat-containing protein [Pedobacter segetis]MBK0383651.1 right-handed parallel beta-helix repeat-containing protein [Pedobacter segetis]
MRFLKKTIALAVAGCGLLSACTKTNVEPIQVLSENSQMSSNAVNSVSSISYYVATTGSDSNSGTISSPFKTIQKGLDVAGPGSDIYVRGGVYNERLNWTNSGTTNNDVVLRNYGSEVVYLDGSTASAQDAMIIVNDKSNLTIKGINIRNNIRAYAKGIYVYGSGANVSIQDCKLYNIGWSTDKTIVPSGANQANPLVVVGTGATAYSNIYIAGTEIYDCVTGYSECLTLNGNINGFLIDNNNVHDNTNIGIDVAGHYSYTGAPAAVNQARNGTVSNNTVSNCVSLVAISAGIYADGAFNIDIVRNKLTGNGCGISLGCENANNTSSEIEVKDNFIYNNRTAGIIIGANAFGSKVTDAVVTNNTFFKNYAVGGYGGEIHFQNVDGLTFKNNIVQSASNVAVIALSGYTSTNLNMDYNMYYTLSGSSGSITFDWGGINGGGYYSLTNFIAGTGKDTHSNYYNPLFVSSTLPNPDLHLTSTSPAINSGDPSFATGIGEKDIDNGTRLLNGRVEKGADEVSSANPPTI